MTSNVDEKIRQKRLEMGYTQEELANKLGYKNRSSINKMENSRELPLKKIEMMADALNVSPSYLMGWDINLQQNGNNGNISNNIGSSDNDNNNDSNNTYTTTNNYYSNCKKKTQNADCLFNIFDNLREMSDEELVSVLNYTDFLLRKKG